MHRSYWTATAGIVAFGWTAWNRWRKRGCRPATRQQHPPTPDLSRRGARKHSGMETYEVIATKLEVMEAAVVAVPSDRRYERLARLVDVNGIDSLVPSKYVYGRLGPTSWDARHYFETARGTIEVEVSWQMLAQRTLLPAAIACGERWQVALPLALATSNEYQLHPRLAALSPAGLCALGYFFRPPRSPPIRPQLRHLTNAAHAS